MSDSLPEEIADVLDLVLSPDEPTDVALRRQVPRLRVQSRCKCGCGTAYFELDTDAVVPAPTGPGTVVAADVQLFTETGECTGEVLVFAQGGYLSWLEVCSWSEDVEVNLAAARRWLQPSSGTRAGSIRRSQTLTPSPRPDRHHEFKFSSRA